MDETTEVQAPEAQGQTDSTTQEVQPTAQAPEAQGPSGPWADALSQKFEDAGIRGEVDAFLREQVQPYVTNLEQERSQYKEAQEFLQQLESEPIETYLAMTQELLDEQAAQAVIEALTGTPQPQADQFAENPYEGQFVRDPEIEELLQRERERQAAELYDAELARVQAAHPDIKPDLFHPFVAAAEGDFDAAYEQYREWDQQAQQTYGIQVPDPNAVTPPPALGSESAAAPAPPIERKYESLDDALDAWFDERKSAPPVVGSA